MRRMVQNACVTLLSVGLLVATGTVKAAPEATTDIQVIMDGHRLAFPDAKPFIDANSRTLVPVRFVAENLGAKVAWHDDVDRVDIAIDGKYISLTIGQKEALVNGEEVMFDTAAIIQQGRTFVPLRFVSEALGESVEWDAASQYVWLGGRTILTAEEKGIGTSPFHQVKSLFEGYGIGYEKSPMGDPYTEFYELSIDDLPIKIGEYIYLDLDKFEMGGYTGLKLRVMNETNSPNPIFLPSDTFRPRLRTEIPSLRVVNDDGSVTGTYRVVESRDWDLHGDKNYLSFSLDQVEYIGIRDLNPMMILIKNPFN